MNPYVLLGAAIASELLGTTALKLSEGFSKPVPSLGVVLGYGVAFYLVSLTLEELPLGVVYGTWAAWVSSVSRPSEPSCSTNRSTPSASSESRSSSPACTASTSCPRWPPTDS